ncbi:polysaccharide biosynthesis protein [Myroides odoratimimus]|uniref:hypothetical protein n=1 Tax=Myroides odoratimimus TaxID=76832 RepID=UPI002575823D|nr:hypothetical protein [Myroides odoratimimus]MDM1496781.1 polysaccharide biosynthesis protein [Myroides odoratimimus]MDM1530443.1 polysaccharide biosynthesis protein [Myroides odoratimimus]
MGSQIAKNSLFLYFRLVFLMFISFYTSRKLLELLGIDDFGVYNVVGSIVAIFGSIKGLMTSSTQRFLNFEMGKGNYSNVTNVFSMSVIVHLILALFFILVVEVFGLWYIGNKLVVDPSRLNAVYYVFQFSLFTVIVSILTVPYDALIIAHEKMKVYAYVSILDGLLKLLMIFVLIYLNGDNLILYAFSVLIISILIRVISSLYCKFKFRHIQFKWLWDSLLFRDMMTFSGWQFLGNTSFALQAQGINMLLNFFHGPVLNTARGLSLQVSGAIQTFTQNLLVASNPQIVKLYAQGEQKQFVNLVLKVSKYSFFMILLMVIPFLLYTDKLVIFWLSNIPEYLPLFLKLTLIYSIIRVFHNPLDSAIKASGDIKKYQVVDSFCLLLSLPLAFLFLWLRFNPVSVIIAMIFVELITLIAILRISFKIIGVRLNVYVKQVVVPSSVVCFIFMILFFVRKYFLYDLNLFVELIYFGVIYFLLIVYIWFFGINKEDKKIIEQKIFRK